MGFGGGGVVWCLDVMLGGGGWWCTPLSHQPPQNVDLSRSWGLLGFTFALDISRLFLPCEQVSSSACSHAVVSNQMSREQHFLHLLFAPCSCSVRCLVVLRHECCLCQATAIARCCFSRTPARTMSSSTPSLHMDRLCVFACWPVVKLWVCLAARG